MCYNIAVRRKGVCMDFELLQWEPSLAPSLAESANDAKIDWWRGEEFPSPYTEEDAKKYIDSTFVMNRLEGNNFCAIVADDRAIGSISLMARGLGVRKFCAELGYWLNPAYWGKGIMTEAVRRICGKAFEETDVRRIQAEVFAPNAASCRVLEKCGFALEGTLRKSTYKRGEFFDSRIYALLKE